MARFAPCRRQRSRPVFDGHQRKRAAVSYSLIRLAQITAALFLFGLLLSGCQSRGNKQRASIEFSRIPPAAQGGRERVDTIAGRVTGAQPGQRIVVYARSGPWWVQPWPDQPFLTIEPDTAWSTTTHLGYQYAALLVDPSYQPPPTLDVAPTQGGSVIAVKIVNGVGTLPPLPTEPIPFSGYDWDVQTSSAIRGGVNNLYDADNVWKDAGGALHLRISKKPKGWTCAHVILNRSLGYGTYSFVVRETFQMEPAAVLSMHTFDQWGGDQHYREMDIEIGHWGDPASKNNAQYGIQPFYVPGNVSQFVEPPGKLTETMRWEAGQASFKTVRGSSLRAGSPVVYEHTFTTGVPTPGRELLEFMLYIVPSDKDPIQKGTEVVVEKFEYFP